MSCCALAFFGRLLIMKISKKIDNCLYGLETHSKSDKKRAGRKNEDEKVLNSRRDHGQNHLQKIEEEVKHSILI